LNGNTLTRPRVVERLGEAFALRRRRLPGVLAEHQDRGVVEIEVRQEDPVDHADQFFLILLEFVAMSVNRRGQLVGNRLHDRGRVRLGGIGSDRCGRLAKSRCGNDGAESDRGGKNQSAQHG
jgi:hypothetical protein